THCIINLPVILLLNGYHNIFIKGCQLEFSGFKSVNTFIDHNPFEPGSKGYLPIKLVQFGKGPDKTFLHSFFGFIGIPKKSERHTIHSFAILVVKLKLSLAVVLPAIFY